MRISDWSSDVCSSDLVGAIEVLVVEDDPRVLAATVGAIEELGHRPIACGDPLLAPSVLARHPQIELIVSDVLMPTQTGPEMIAALAQLNRHLAVLFVTGYSAEATGDRKSTRLNSSHECAPRMLAS